MAIYYNVNRVNLTSKLSRVERKSIILNAIVSKSKMQIVKTGVVKVGQVLFFHVCFPVPSVVGRKREWGKAQRFTKTKWFFFAG